MKRQSSEWEFNQFSHSVVSDSLRPHESQHARPPCPSPTPGVHSDSCQSSQWCHPAISSSVVPFSSCPQSLPAQSFFQWVNSLHLFMGFCRQKSWSGLPFCFSLIFPKSHFHRALLIYRFYNNFPSMTSNYSTSLFLNLQSRSLLLFLIITNRYYHYNRMGTNLLLIPGKYLQLQ